MKTTLYAVSSSALALSLSMWAVKLFQRDGDLSSRPNESTRTLYPSGLKVGESCGEQASVNPTRADPVHLTNLNEDCRKTQDQQVLEGIDELASRSGTTV